MYVIQEAKQQVLTELKKAVGKEFTPTMDDLSTPPDPKLGDVAFPCFALSKGLKRNPAEIASEIAAKIGPKGFIKSVTAHGPYVNIIFDDAVLGDAVLAEIVAQGKTYGASTAGNGKKVMVEYAQPNTHKEIHVGHLRNFFVGQTLVHVLRENGYQVIPTSYINDLGAHVATCLWALRASHKGENPKTKGERVSLMGKAYAEGTLAGEQDPAIKGEISSIYLNLENLKGSFVSLWKRTRGWSLAYIRSIFKELKLPIEVWYYESDLIAETKKAIETLIKKGVVTKSEGAWIVDFTEEKLGVNLLVKSDGTLLYNAKDIALALRKEHEYKPQRSLYVIDARQSLAMQQLFATLKRMGFDKELAHLSYEFVTLKDGAMSSRKGNIIRYEVFRDAMVSMAREETKKRHPEWTDKVVEKTAHAVAFAAIRFAMLRQDLDKKIVFDMEEALSFDGFTGPYLLYTVARVASVLKKGRALKVKPLPTGKHLKEHMEHRLLLALAHYPDVVFEAGKTMRLSVLAQYLFDLSKAFAEFYENVSVLQAPGTELVAARLALVSAVGQTLENGMRLLGIETLKEM